MHQRRHIAAREERASGVNVRRAHLLRGVSRGSLVAVRPVDRYLELSI